MTDLAQRPRPDQTRRSARPPWLNSHRIVFVAISICCVVFMVAPTLLVVVASISPQRYVAFPPSGFTLQWFSGLDEVYLDPVLLSLKLGASATLISMLLGMPAALAVSRSGLRSAPMLDSLLRVPLQVPYVVTGISFLQYYSMFFGQSEPIVLSGTFLGLLIAHSVICVPFVLSSAVAGLTQFDRGLEEAAYGLGAGRLRTFFTITLPILRPSVAAGAFFAFLISFDNVPVSLFLSVQNVSTLPVTMFFTAEFSYGPHLFAMATLLTIASTVVVLVYDRVIGLRSGASNVSS